MGVPVTVLKGLVHATGYGPSRKLERSLGFSKATQEKTLADLLERNRGTVYGKRHGFGDIRSSLEYQIRVPIQDYDGLSPEIDRIRRGDKGVLFPGCDRLHMFGLTSGTTGNPKTIPITDRYVKRFRQTYSIWSTRILRDHPGLVEGKYLAMYSDWRETFTDKGVPCGAVTGLLASLQPPWIRKRMVAPPQVSRIKDPAVKEAAVLHHALAHETVLWTSANPSTLLRLARSLAKNLDDLLRGLSDGTFPHLSELDPAHRNHPDFRPNPERARLIGQRIEAGGNVFPTTIWPNLQILSCWMGGTLTPYLSGLRSQIPGADIRDPGLMASEGRFTIPIDDNTASGVPDLNSLFFEFHPADGDEKVPIGSAEPLLLSHEVEVGKKYFLIFSCDWGLYRYHIDDIVEVTGRIGDVPLIRFVRKGSGYSSITGEKLSEDQVVKAIESLPDTFRNLRNDLVVAPVWGDPPGYLLFIEEGPDLSEQECCTVGERMEREIRGLNCEYEAKRESHRLQRLRVALVQPGTFDRIKGEDIERAGGRSEQYKLKRIQGDLEFANRFGSYRIIET